jgi:hypothetical protein
VYKNLQPCSESQTGGKSVGRGISQGNVLLITTKNISNVLSGSMTLQREERQRGRFGSKSFLLSLLQLMGTSPFDVAIEARYTITDWSRNISASRLASYSAIAPASAFAASPLIVMTDV